MTYKQIIWSDHAVMRMRERGYGRGDVRWLLAQGARMVVQTFGGHQKRFGKQGKIRGTMVAVIYMESATAIEIITVEELD